MKLLIFIFGLFIGSFLNVCIYRIPKGESIIYPSSHCPKCNTNLKPIDLIPVISFLFHKRKCRYCGENISLQYPFIELLNGFIYLFLYIKYDTSIFFIQYMILTSLLIVISMIDIQFKIIPDACNLFGFITAIILILFKNPTLLSFKDAFFGLLIGGGFFLIIAILTNAMGGGDIKLMGVLGLFFGWKMIVFITFFSFCIGSILSILLILFKIKNKKDPIAFGPFISLAVCLAIFYGTEIINRYLSFLLYLGS
ncbi:prepilin peptidase [Inediibacterium massiliense]|uniref:prepilin peptidase n=1 Tax=Inediibacterium massiliense TaxID=1658111 RepID=UPI0006B48AA2|nr:A24 family peptidase [Inediibacterium massiliense]